MFSFCRQRVPIYSIVMGPPGQFPPPCHEQVVRFMKNLDNQLPLSKDSLPSAIQFDPVRVTSVPMMQIVPSKPYPPERVLRPSETS
jgi:hypothetical protein